ncbi:unnamed protein product [Rotaria magnacalcarata]|uniref:Uncharacterized protein n=2 Tax=Rotaria magnacalcarata TaxID=392030 RepID=A0A816WWP2_9BILA|nr:unnamed protein product [Rotaria magnacalcarata]CAF2139665.1 unnamed protein product [Rotaria magnacalcarata]CAF3841925.1 unnamed protein product [Rotaria magnacalcarata]CAF3862208.1 unnamed protein product [Rotaria magnacalcarata]
MTLKDCNSEKTTSNQLESIDQSSTNKEIKKNDYVLDHSNKKFKQIRMSLLNLIHSHRSSENIESKTTHSEQQQQQDSSSPKRPSIIKSTDIPRSVSKKSVAFASAIDQDDSLNEDEDLNLNLERNTNDVSSSETDIVTVITNRRIDDDITINTNKNMEPYPFRSEIDLSLSSQFYSQTIYHHSRKNIISRFIHHRHPKKILHSLPTIASVSTMNRSTSTPNMVISSSSSINPITKPKTNGRRRPLKTIRAWFKTLSLRPFLRSNHKQTQENNASKIKKQPIPHRSAGLRRFSELLL